MFQPPATYVDLAALAVRLRATVEHLAVSIGPRHLENGPSFHEAAKYVEGQLGNGGDEVHREWYAIGSEPVANYWIERKGVSSPNRAQSDNGHQPLVILGAHYDTTATTPGADDNASAVAVLIEAARLLRGVECPCAIRFVAFACEEAPYAHTDNMGSAVHAMGCRQRGEEVRAMVCLEMVGYYTDEPDSQAVPPAIPGWLRWVFPRRGNFLASVANPRSVGVAWKFHHGFRRASRLPLFSVALPERVREIRRSDNSSFWDQGYPALMVTDTSFLRNRHYHQPSDTPDTLDFHRMALAALGVAGGVARLAGRRKAPWR